CMIIFSAVFSTFSYESVISAADTSLYPAQAVNFTAYTTARNINKSGTSLNTQIASGSTTENWRIDYVSDGIYNIVNMSDNSYLTANGTKCITSAASNASTQQWNIIGTYKDFLGNYLYYKIINVSTGTALTYYQSNNSIGLAEYTNDGAQKWKLNCYGLEGFAANSKMSEGEKAGTIGGLLGETIFVSDMKSMKEALLRT
ncbi:MAG: RICIN domain-containing protein, partial [Oscillospiraceae bacterium]|nr:RICIN domain-containing protein [Oscillospiraceae bacterium]